MSETASKIDAAASAAVKNAADAEAAESVAVAGAAEAQTVETVAQASETIVAAATGAAALAEVNAAKANVNAAETVAQVEGDMSWLKTNQELLASSQNEFRKELEPVKAIPSIISSLQKMQEALNRLSPPPLQQQLEEGQEVQIVDPAQVSQSAKDAETGVRGGKPKAEESQKRNRVWTTGRKA